MVIAVHAFFNTQHLFTIIGKKGEVESFTLSETTDKDMSRSLIARDVDVFLTHRLSLEAFILLKSYGIRIYALPAEPQSYTAALEAFHRGMLSELTPANITGFLPAGSDELAVPGSAAASKEPR